MRKNERRACVCPLSSRVAARCADRPPKEGEPHETSSRAARRARERPGGAAGGASRAAHGRRSGVPRDDGGVRARRFPLPQRVEVTRIPRAFLVESPEPLHLDRVRLEIARAASPPLRFTTIAFADETLAPDSGRFAWAGREWTTTAELRSNGGLLRPRIATQSLELTMPLDRAGSVSAVVAADAGASISLGGVDAGAAIGPVTRAPATAGDVTITLTGAALSSATLSGTGFAVRSIIVGEPFSARLPTTAVRLADLRLPASPSDKRARAFGSPPRSRTASTRSCSASSAEPTPTASGRSSSTPTRPRRCGR